MIKIDTDLFLDDFEIEAKTHLERIESSFLDAGSLTSDPKMIDAVFRTAHSLKGTAGFFSLKEIVAVSHELESVFSQIKEGSLAIDGELIDIVLLSVDYLRDLIGSIRSGAVVDTADHIEKLRKYSKDKSPEEKAEEKTTVPFNIRDPEIEDILGNATRHGHKIYYVNLGFDRGLGKFYKHPDLLFDGIMSIGSIVRAIVNGNTDDEIKEKDPAVMAEKIKSALSENDTSTLELLVTSVLEFDLFSIATEIDKKNIYILSKGAIFEVKAEEKAEKPIEPVSKPVSASLASSSIHLDISIINGLVDLANEMILTRNRLNSAMAEYKKSIPGITPIMQDLNRLTSEIQERTMLTRMQPISVIFGKFPRIIRDMSRALNKEIEIEVIGGVMLDKYLLDSLTDPITQIVKNSADHGVESVSRRKELGKPGKGKITLGSYMHDGFAVIEVTDDGAGMDVEVLKRKGLERGLVTEDKLDSLTDSEVFSFIFEPGFSTASTVTDLSGRGVGMDIVKTNIEELGGSIEIDSRKDIGTTIWIKMPLTLSVLRTLIVTIGSVKFGVPEVNVERIVRVGRGIPSRRIERLNNSLVLILDGRIIPLVTMEEIDAKAKRLDPPATETILDRILSVDVSKYIVLKADDKSFALLIDDALGTEQTLVKPLPEYLLSCFCYSNVTVLGDGNAITILNAEGILRLMGIEGASKTDLSEEWVKDKITDKQYIIFKSLGAEYYALETNEISRIETICQAQIQEMGKGNYINIGEKTVRVIRPEDFVPVKKRRLKDNEKKMYMLTLKNSMSNIGFLAERVIDKVDDTFSLVNDQIISEYIFGTGIYYEKILIFLDPSAITEEVERKIRTKKRGDED